MKKAIATDRAPQAIGPYSQAIQAGNLLFISGQIPVNPEDGTIISHNIEKQTHQVLKNIEAILTEAGYSLSDVVKTTVFLKDMSDFETVNTIYGQYFKHPFPLAVQLKSADYQRMLRLKSRQSPIKVSND